MKTKIIQDKKKFYSKLFLYKTFWYKNVNFETEIEEEEIKAIIEALNIKKRSKRIEFIYDYCCKKIDKFYEGKNICGFKNGQCICHQRPGCDFKNGCCRLCSFQSSKGCKTTNLSCKLFYCDRIKENNKILTYKDLQILKLFSFRQRMIARDNFFASKEEFLLDLKIGSIVFYAYSAVFRMMKSSIYLRKQKI